MKRIEFGELRINDTAKSHIQNCLDTNWASMGPKTKLLEEKFAELMGTTYAVATSSGTSSLTMVTLALPELAKHHKKREVVRGKSKVLCPGLAFIANSTAIVSGGLIPKWVDIRPETLNMNEDLVEDAIDDDVVAIYAVGTMGRPCDMAKLKAIADKYDLILFEDGCENYGSFVDGQFSHKYAIGGCSSFFQAHLVQAGEGSCIYTDDEFFRDLLISIRSHGRDGTSAYFDHIRFGGNFKTTDLCASLALGGIEEFHDNIKARKVAWSYLNNWCIEHCYEDFMWFSSSGNNMDVMPHGFSITVKPDSGYSIYRLQKILDQNNIHWKRNFGFCGHHAALSRYYDGKDAYPWSIWCGDNGLHIGTHRYLTLDDLRRMTESIEAFVSEGFVDYE